MKTARVVNGALGAVVLCCVLAFAQLRVVHGVMPVLVYGVLPVLLVSLCGFALIRPLPFRKGVLFGIFLAGIAVYILQAGVLWSKVFEARARRTVPGWDQYKAAWRLGEKFDKRSPLQVIQDLRKNGEDPVPALPPSLFWFDGEKLVIDGVPVIPVGAISSAKTVYCNETGEYLIYTSDEHGFHNPPGLYGEAPDIVAIGDSMTQGACVHDDENAVAQIRKQFPRTLDLGYADNGPLTELATLTEMGPRLKPKLVLWFFYEGNDMDDLVNERHSVLLTPYLDRTFSRGLFGMQEKIDAGLRAIAGKREAAALAKKTALLEPEDLHLLQASAGDFIFLRLLRSALGLMDAGWQRSLASADHAALPMFRQILTQARELVETWNGKIIFVYLPEWMNFAQPGYHRPERDGVLAAVRDAGIAAIDVLPEFQAHPDPLSLFPHRAYGHYNAEGYRLEAKTVLASLPR